MAWYRVGGGGLPNSVKTDMNNVLNKKFGTSTTYPAAGWPDTVNLMGMLEEKTVSGAIAHIPDGADRVPIKSWEVEITPTLTGVSEVECAQAGSNLWDEEWEEGLISASDGQDTPSDQYSRTKNYISVKPSSSVYLYFGVTRIYLRRYGKDKGYLGYAQINTSSIWNVPSDTYYIRFCWDGTTYNDDISVNYPSTETAYQYSTIATVSTVNLGRTIYGGKPDVVNGTGKETFARIDMGDLTWQYDSANTRFFTVGLTSVIEKGSSDWKTELVTDLYTTARGTANDKTISEYASTGYVYIKDTDYSDPTQFKNHVSGHYLVYPLATPTDFTFTPITPTPETALGTNNFWADSGDSEVTYRGQGTVTVYPNAEEASF